MLAFGDVAFDQRLEGGVGEQAAQDPVQRRGEARDADGGEEAAGTQDAQRLGERALAVAGLGEVVERAEQEDGVAPASAYGSARASPIRALASAAAGSAWAAASACSTCSAIGSSRCTS
jgi:hypothetical protein